jgi:iron complex transport system substrate-binding protein
MSGIVSLLPSATEILFAIGAGERIVGVTHECDYPAAARTLPALTRSALPDELQTHLGAERSGIPIAQRSALINRHVTASVHAGSSLYFLDEARLASLAPDLIVTQELCAVCAVSYDVVATAARRLTADPRIVSLEPTSLEDVFSTIITLGDLAGARAGAGALVQSLRGRMTRLRDRVNARSDRPSTLVLEWTDPPMSGGHWTPGITRDAGGTPVLAHPGANSQAITWEAIAAADPDVVIIAPCGYDLAHARDAIAELDAVPQWRALRARTNGRAYAIDGNAYVNRPGPRLVDTAELFAAAIAGDDLAALDGAAIELIPPASATR